jgi:hypothetical protein
MQLILLQTVCAGQQMCGSTAVPSSEQHLRETCLPTANANRQATLW